MNKLFNRCVPSWLKSIFRRIKLSTSDRLYRLILVYRTRVNETRLVNNLKGDKKIKVVFLAIHSSVWKVDSIFKRMVDDPLFEPEILVCPYTAQDNRRMHEDMNDSYEYFKRKGYMVTKALTANGKWVKLKNLDPDLIFFTNPYKLTKSEYYETAYKNYLCCYVPYYFMATTHTGSLSHQLNTPMLNAMWRVYWPHEYIFNQFCKYSFVNGKNSKLTGYPATEVLVAKNREYRRTRNIWLNSDSIKKKIIYAPHHTISNDSLSLSTFLKFGKLIREISEEYQNQIHWSFKPHPMLKEKLYAHSDWGENKTNEFYSYWQESSYTQLDLGAYDDLFNESDALIHDCSSFIGEYSFTRKPALYLFNEVNEDESFLNEFGKKIFETHLKASTEEEIRRFLIDLIDEKEVRIDREDSFFEAYLSEFYKCRSPSQVIIDDIKDSLLV